MYISIPFCKAKCSFCNFSSGVFPRAAWNSYLDAVCAEIDAVRSTVHSQSGATDALTSVVDTIYLGGGTPSLLEPTHIHLLFNAVRRNFAVTQDAEITVECAPGQLSDASLSAFKHHGVNRLSFGVQSFVDAESAAVGRLHIGAAFHEELDCVRSAGIDRLAIDLIAGLPGQTLASFRHSVEQAIASGVEHVSLYMLEVDDGSRLGRESLLGGHRYGASLLPTDDAVADFYAAGCSWLEEAGLMQYEISNFARHGAQSRHNRKYWLREPYLGFGLDAHSMLRQGPGGVRWAKPDEMDLYLANVVPNFDLIGREAAFEETLFLGLRLTEGVSLSSLRRDFGDLADSLHVGDLLQSGFLSRHADRIQLTPAGRMASNEVFERLLLPVLV